VRRRDFISIFAGAIVAWPLAARSQQFERVRHIGVLAPFNGTDPESLANLAAFKRRLSDLGWTEGLNIAVDYHFTSGSIDEIRAAAAALVAAGPDMIFAASNVSVAVLQRATTSTPIVFVQVSDPVGSGFVESLAKPGANMTGFQGYEPAIGGKWLEVLKEVTPRVRHVAVVIQPSVSANVAFLRSAEVAGRSLGVTVIAAPAKDAADIERVLGEFARDGDRGVIITPSPLTNTSEKREFLFALTARLKLPAVYPYRLTPESGGLVSYSYGQVAQWEGAASYVDRVLRGAKPADLPVQAPNKYEFVINLRAARTLGLDIPPALLTRADELID